MSLYRYLSPPPLRRAVVEEGCEGTDQIPQREVRRGV